MRSLSFPTRRSATAIEYVQYPTAYEADRTRRAAQHLAAHCGPSVDGPVRDLLDALDHDIIEAEQAAFARGRASQEPKIRTLQLNVAYFKSVHEDVYRTLASCNLF